MEYDEIQERMEKAAKEMGNALDFELWWSWASSSVVAVAELKYPLTGKTRNVFDRRTKAGKFIEQKRREARLNFLTEIKPKNK